MRSKNFQLISNLIDRLVKRRLAERARQQIANDATEAREEHRQGKTKVVSVDDLKREIGL